MRPAGNLKASRSGYYIYMYVGFEPFAPKLTTRRADCSSRHPVGTEEQAGTKAYTLCGTGRGEERRGRRGGGRGGGREGKRGGRRSRRKKHFFLTGMYM